MPSCLFYIRGNQGSQKLPGLGHACRWSQTAPTRLPQGVHSPVMCTASRRIVTKGDDSYRNVQGRPTVKSGSLFLENLEGRPSNLYIALHFSISLSALYETWAF